MLFIKVRPILLKQSDSDKNKLALENSKKVLKDFLKTLIMPMLVNKSFMFYFALNYSNHPDEGYGYGFAATLVILFITLGTFVWKYRHIDDP